MRAANSKLFLVRADAEVSDDSLMREARDGSMNAFEQLVRRHQARVLRMAARYASDASLAQDIAQNTFVELHRALHRYEPRGHFGAYLARIAINQCRIEGRRKRWPLLSVLAFDAPLCSARDDLPDLQRAVAQLSDKLREVVVLRYSGDLDLGDIAEALDLPLGTVKRRLFDAMAKLRQTLGGEV
jgi:RNA polymerase sigma factor (sigma-70 family)